MHFRSQSCSLIGSGRDAHPSGAPRWPTLPHPHAGELMKTTFHKNIRLTIEYNGQAFHGWQKQPGLKTIQSELERVLKIVIREEISGLQAAGRTDSGVHARAQVVNFKTNADVDLLRLKHSVSSILKGELAVVGAEYVPLSFNALRSARARQYTYWILNREAPAVLDRGGVWHVTATLDVQKMQEAASVLVGRHDFSAFRDGDCNSLSPIKEIFESEVTRDGHYLVYRVVGKGFLKQMVRIITGTLVQLGRGTLKTQTMEEVLKSRDRTQAGITAPPYGLYLDRVFYDES